MTQFERWLLAGLFVLAVLVASGHWPDSALGTRVDGLVADLQSPRADVRSAACREVRRFGPAAGAAVPELIAQLEKGQNAEALNALLAIGPAASLAPLARALDDRSTAAGAAVAISLFGPAARRTRPALLKALENPEARPFAEQALQAIEDPVPATIMRGLRGASE